MYIQGFYTSKVAHDFVHQQYDSGSDLILQNIGECPNLAMWIASRRHTHKLPSKKETYLFQVDLIETDPSLWKIHGILTLLMFGF